MVHKIGKCVKNILMLCSRAKLKMEKFSNAPYASVFTENGKDHKIVQKFQKI